MRKLNIAMIVPHNTYNFDVVEGASECARDIGDTEVFLWGQWHPNGRDVAGLPKWADHHLSSFNIAGIVTTIWGRQMLRRLQRIRIPVLDVGGTWPEGEMPGIHVDNVAVGRIGARHLLDKGLRHFGFWGQTLPLHARQRRDGFVSELKKAGFSCSVCELEPKAVPWREGSNLAVMQWMTSLPKPAGVMAWFIYRAIAAQYVCRLAKIAIPEEVALIGVEEDRLSQLQCHVPLTSIDVNAKRVGYKAMEMLVRMIRTGRRPARHVLVPPGNVIARQSTDILAIENRELAEAMRFIKNNSDKPISVGDVLKAVPISRRQLEIQCQKFLGRTPRQQIRHEQVERAKVLIEDYDVSLGEIAEMSGFKFQVSFTNIFKSLTGCTPMEFRRRLRQPKPN
jgi:LacI family transcriptional regulator